MNKVLKKITCILVISCLFIGLCACQKKDDKAGSTTAEPREEAANVEENTPRNKTKAEETTKEEVKTDESVATANEITETDVNIIHPIVYHKQLVCSKQNSWERGVNCEYDLFRLSDEDKAEYPIQKYLVFQRGFG